MPTRGYPDPTDQEGGQQLRRRLLDGTAHVSKLDAVNGKSAPFDEGRLIEWLVTCAACPCTRCAMRIEQQVNSQSDLHYDKASFPNLRRFRVDS